MPSLKSPLRAAVAVIAVLTTAQVSALTFVKNDAPVREAEVAGVDLTNPVATSTDDLLPTLPALGPDDVTGFTNSADGRIWLVNASGKVRSPNGAKVYGSATQPADDPVVGMSAPPDGRGYVLVTSRGEVVSAGDLDLASTKLRWDFKAPVVGIAMTPTGDGYWVVGSNGAVIVAGDAVFKGSLLDTELHHPVAGLVPTPTGNGYWMLTEDGVVVPFGDARWYGDVSGRRPLSPISSIAVTNSGKGYWLVTRDGVVRS
jgi:hypothetical protein